VPNVDDPAGGVLVCAYVTDDPNRIGVPDDMSLVAHLTTRGDDTYAVAYERRHAPGVHGAQDRTAGRRGGGQRRLGACRGPGSGEPRLTLTGGAAPRRLNPVRTGILPGHRKPGHSEDMAISARVRRMSGLRASIRHRAFASAT
jgi:hypothetical protein